MEQLQQYWYQFGAYIALVIALLCAIWVFVDSIRKSKSALVWQIVEVIAVIVILPSVVFALLPAQSANFPALLMPLMLVGIVGAVAAVIVLILYLFGVAVSEPYTDAGSTMQGVGMQSTVAAGGATGQMPVYNNPSATAPGFSETTTAQFNANNTGGASGSMPSLPGKTINMPGGGSSGTMPPASGDQTGYFGSSGASASYGSGSPSGESGTMILRQTPQVYGYFVLRTGVHKGKTFPLGNVTNIGRRADANDIVLDDESVSREHARVRFQDDQYVFTDLASGNGSFVKDVETGEWKKIHQVTLTDKLVLKLGETQVTYMEVRPQKETEGD